MNVYSFRRLYAFFYQAELARLEEQSREINTAILGQSPQCGKEGMQQVQKVQTNLSTAIIRMQRVIRGMDAVLDEVNDEGDGDKTPRPSSRRPKRIK